MTPSIGRIGTPRTSLGSGFRGTFRKVRTLHRIELIDMMDHIDRGQRPDRCGDNVFIGQGMMWRVGLDVTAYDECELTRIRAADRIFHD